MSKTLCIGLNDGIGGSLLTAQCAYFIKQYNEYTKNNREVEILYAARKDVFIPLEYLLWDKFTVKPQKDEEKWGNNNYIFNHQEELDIYKEQGFDEFFVICPDYLYRNPGAFNYKKYNTNPQVIKSTRLLTHRYSTNKNDIPVIFLALTSTTPGYMYEDTAGLIKEIAKQFPDYTIFFPFVEKWADKLINYGDLTNLPSNVYVYHNPDLIHSIQVLQTASYCVCLDNGFSHIAWHLGVPRLLLDPRIGSPRTSDPWVARWRETLEDSIPINYPVDTIIRLIKANIEIPQTLLLPRISVAFFHGGLQDWKNHLIFKF